ncbi:MAG: hypothetical protein M1828_000955 [Chrysothrix sp. TS-e1954]|nr:MAG: hypothetical protein M1828_000955 [Chrysothrix sp. TS-e1954]
MEPTNRPQNPGPESQTSQPPKVSALSESTSNPAPSLHVNTYGLPLRQQVPSASIVPEAMKHKVPPPDSAYWYNTYCKTVAAHDAERETWELERTGLRAALDSVRKRFSDDSGVSGLSYSLKSGEHSSQGKTIFDSSTPASGKESAGPSASENQDWFSRQASGVDPLAYKRERERVAHVQDASKQIQDYVASKIPPGPPAPPLSGFNTPASNPSSTDPVAMARAEQPLAPRQTTNLSPHTSSPRHQRHDAVDMEEGQTRERPRRPSRLASPLNLPNEPVHDTHDFLGTLTEQLTEVSQDIRRQRPAVLDGVAEENDEAAEEEEMHWDPSWHRARSAGGSRTASTNQTNTSHTENTSASHLNQDVPVASNAPQTSTRSSTDEDDNGGVKLKAKPSLNFGMPLGEGPRR